MTTLVIVESPGKVKHLGAILGGGYRVMASVGHVRDLPKKSMGVAPPDFRPQYENTERGAEVLTKLAAAVKQAEDVVLASDLDREGEAIAWHLMDALHLKNPKRVTFGSITDVDVKAGIAHPRSINMDLVHAQEARRVLDRLVGYTASPILSRQSGQKLSAGRVQSPAVRLVVDREREIAAFKPTEHYTAVLSFGPEGKVWTATWDTRPFLDKEHPYFLDQAFAAEVAKLRDVRVSKFEDSQARKGPPAAFTTSTLQQSAQAALKFRPKLTMDLAQKLYEQGVITYHRTDTPNLSEEGFKLLAAWAKGANVPLETTQRHWKAKAGSQEAHECIRPTAFANKVAGETPEQQQLYALIWKRTVASQMPDAVYAVRTAVLDAVQVVGGKPVTFIARGRTLLEPGWRALYGGAEPASDEDTKDEDRDNPIPALKVGATGHATAGKVITKHTKAPARYKLSTLIKRMEELEIGRPSTYAAIMENITARGYIKEGKSGFLAPEPAGEAIVDALVGKCEFIDLDYTKRLEGELDEIAHGKAQYLPVVKAANDLLTTNVAKISATQVAGTNAVPCPSCGSAMRRIKGKNGFFWGCSSYPTCKTTAPDKKGKPDFTAAGAHTHSGGAMVHPEFKCADCGSALVHRKGKAKTGGKPYDFWGCSNYPACKTSYQNGKDDRPTYPEKAAA